MTHLTLTMRKKLESLTDDWREEEDGWESVITFYRLELLGLCEMQDRKISGGDVDTGPGSWGSHRWFTRRTAAGRALVASQDRGAK